MNTKWKIIALVMLIIISICGVFITLIVFDNRENLQTFVAREIESIRAVVTTIEEENGRYYRNRIKAFVSYAEVPKQEQVISAFARQDRDELLRLSTPYLNFFKKENPSFSTFGWVTADNHNFLRVHRPALFGDDIGKLRSDIMAAGKEQKQVAGYMITKSGFQYCIVQPVSYADKPVGIIHFGLKLGPLLDTLEKKLNIPVGMAIPNDKFAVAKFSEIPTFANSTHTVQSKQIDLFQQQGIEIDWALKQQQVTLQGKTYIIANALNLLNHEHESQGFIFVALDISPQQQKLQAHISFILLISATMLVLSFLVIFKSYGSLVEKIIGLNQALEQNNYELESRVLERTTRLSESEKRLQKILDQAPLGILIADSQTMSLQYANPTICKMLGYNKEELENMDIPALHTPTDFVRVSKNFKLQSQGEKNDAIDTPFLCKDGTSIEADVISSLIELEGQACTVGFIIDRTEQKNLQTQLHRAQKMEAIGLMAGGVAHDLNNMLAGIINYPELMLLKLHPESELRRPLEAIRDSGQRATAVVADLLTVARGVASTRTLHDINLLIEEYLSSPECQQLKIEHPEITYIQKLDAEFPTLNCSAVHIKKVLMNLITNASEAVSGTGTVNIATNNCQLNQSEGAEKGMDPGGYIVITVQDNGTGIADKDLKHIFEPFYTKKEMGKSGTGLGLAVVWNTVHDHNGKIFVESSDKGTSFQLYFPLSKEESTVQVKTDNTENLTGNGEHILIVDDEASLRDIASAILQNLAYRVDSVSSGEEAIEFVKKTPVDLIVIDMLMEPGINGRQTYTEIIKQYPKQKAIIASGFSESDDVKIAQNLGVGDFISKPYSMEKLGQVVKDVLSAD